MTDETEFDPGSRVLCPDGSCTGVLGADGRCSECGRTGGVPAGYTGAAAVVPDPASEAPHFDLPSRGAPPTQDSDADPGARTVELEGGAGGFDERRLLCPDGACVGVLGPGGRCPVCGQMAGGPAGGASQRQESL
jgi:hypothetical protein